MGEQNQSDVVRVGFADRTPKKFSRRDLITVAGGIAATGVGVYAAKRLGVLGGMDNLSVETASHVEIPSWLLPGTGRITIREQSAGQSKRSDIGTAHVYLETATDLVLVTAEHVGKGFLWQDVDLDFPYSKGNSRIRIDARIDALGGPEPQDSDWWIREISKSSKIEKGIERPIRTIYIAKPKGSDRYVVPPEYVLKAGPDPKPGDNFTVVGFESLQGKFIVNPLKFLGVTKPEDLPAAGISLFEFSGETVHGMSGGAILGSDGLVVALVSRGITIKNKSMTWGIPFAKYQPLTDVFRVIQK